MAIFTLSEIELRECDISIGTCGVIDFEVEFDFVFS